MAPAAARAAERRTKLNGRFEEEFADDFFCGRASTTKASPSFSSLPGSSFGDSSGSEIKFLSKRTLFI